MRLPLCEKWELCTWDLLAVPSKYKPGWKAHQVAYLLRAQAGCWTELSSHSATATYYLGETGQTAKSLWAPTEILVNMVSVVCRASVDHLQSCIRVRRRYGEAVWGRGGKLSWQRSALWA
jgi:hypothetical protein